MNIEEFSKLSDYRKEDLLNSITIAHWSKRIIIGLLIFTLLSLGGYPIYNVWQQGLSGQAELARAQQNRQIAIQEALALKESAEHKKDAEITRAEGVKKSNDIIANGLGGAEGYLRYLYINALSETKCSTIYVPTEAGLPILEAGKR